MIDPENGERAGLENMGFNSTLITLSPKHILAHLFIVKASNLTKPTYCCEYKSSCADSSCTRFPLIEKKKKEIR
jgi:hypothetical protein